MRAARACSHSEAVRFCSYLSMELTKVSPMSRPLLALLLLTFLLPACASPSPAGPVLAISGPIVDATTGAAVVADVYVDGKYPAA
jgi:hypothetical protein